MPLQGFKPQTVQPVSLVSIPTTLPGFLGVRNLRKMFQSSGVPRGVWVVQTPPRNSEVLTKLSRIPSSVENTSVTT